MHGELLNAASSLGLDLNNLHDAADRTQSVIGEAQTEVNRYIEDALGGFTSGKGLDIVAFGSMARDEMAPASDFDYLVIATEIVPDPHLIEVFRQAAVSALEVIGADRPGSSGLFGGMIGAPDMVNQIGLDDDTNKSLTRRILVLQESICLNKHDGYEQLVSSILSRYLHDYKDDEIPRVPRFLFNDMVRYWRTIAVDYQAKRWQEMAGTKWGLRYLKLRSSRKWTFAGSILALFMPVIENCPTTRSYLMRQFSMPPLARLAQLHSFIDPSGQTASSLRQVLSIANDFQGWQNNKEWRKSVAQVDNPTAVAAPHEFQIARDRTHKLQEALEGLFLSSEALNSSGTTLQHLTRKYLTF